MKSTGIVRRIDDLGRVVIPREIRRTLQIKEGEAFELLYDKEGVYFKKYRDDVFDEWAKYLHRYFGDDLIIYDHRGDKICGVNNEPKRSIEALTTNPFVYPVYKDLESIVAYCDISQLRGVEVNLFKTIIDFIASQLEA